MDSFELNKILGAILGTCLGVLSINIAAGAIFAPVKPAKPGYDIVSHVSEHSDAIRVQALLVTFGCLALVVVLGCARDRLAIAVPDGEATPESDRERGEENRADDDRAGDDRWPDLHAAPCAYFFGFGGYLASSSRTAS